MYQLSKGGSWRGALAICALIVAVFTRSVFLVYAPVILFGFYIIFKNKAFRQKYIWPPLILALVMLTLNIPALLLNQSLSYDKKAPPEQLNVTWAQRQYLAQLLVNKGELENYQHPSFQETHEYLLEHGEDALPKSIIKGILFDYKLTIKEFFKDLGHILFYGFRQLGLILIVPLVIFLIKAFRKDFDLQELFIPASLVVTIGIFALIIISYIELRWLIPVFTLAVVYFSDLINADKISKQVITFNHIIFIGMSLFGLYRLFPLII